MQSLNSDIAVFGYGEITNYLISDIVKDGSNIICITNQANYELQTRLKNQVKFYTRSEITDFDLNCNSAVFTWRDTSALLGDNGTLNKWLLSSNFNCRQSLYLSSASVYQDTSGLINESEDNLDFNVGTNPKYVLEQLLSGVMNSKSGFNINLRISNVYGEGLTYGFIASLFDSIKTGNLVRLFSGKEVLRDYISVNDVSFAVRCLIHSQPKQNVVNISTGIATSISEVMSIFKKLGVTFDGAIEEIVEDNFKSSLVLDCNLLSQLIDWRPKRLNEEIKSLLKVI